MKRPQHMTMDELIGLPAVKDRTAILENANEVRPYGGAFEDQTGEVWGTFLLKTGWVRYPAYLSVLGSQPT